MRVTIWRVLVRIPIIGRVLERRWMPDSTERDLHQQIVHERLAAPPVADPQAATARPDD